MTNNTENSARDRLFGLRVTVPEHALMHAAAKAEGENASEWAREILLREAREAFRATLRLRPRVEAAR